jgi:hypothetical protein
MSVEIIGTGYGKKDEDLKVGDTYLQECVVNMWDFPPADAFVYYSANGHQMVLKEYTKTAERTYKARVLQPNEITKEIENCLLEKGNEVFGRFS